uniref:hypothetical protein n=1 Tax=Bacillus sp. WP8 TaxID=756828 RepID=UPI001C92F1B0
LEKIRDFELMGNFGEGGNMRKGWNCEMKWNVSIGEERLVNECWMWDDGVKNLSVWADSGVWRAF